MQTHLMFENKDFDPEKILIARETRYRPEYKPDLNILLPWNYSDLILDLNLETLLDAMADGDNFIYETILVAILNPLQNISDIKYRQEILKDCLNNHAMIRNAYRLTLEVIEKYKELSYWSSRFETPQSIVFQARRKLKFFASKLLELRNIFENNEINFNSTGLNKLIKIFKVELTDVYLSEISNLLEEIEFNNGILINARLGYGNKITEIVLQEPENEKKSWLKKFFNINRQVYFYKIPPLDETGIRSLSELRNKSLYNVSKVLARSTALLLNFFQTLKTELAFYIGCLNLYDKLAKLNIPICFPEPQISNQKKLSFLELHDVILILITKNRPISNDLIANGKNLIIISGANNGGKTTFLRSIGLAQLMMQSGMFVTAKNYSSDIHSAIYTHFKHKEDEKLKSGKFDEELNRINQIINTIDSQSIILMNETFATTNQKEGAEIAKQIIEALLECGIKVLFVTHNYEFTKHYFEKKPIYAFNLQAERLINGVRTFKIKEGKPLQTSFGEDLLQKVFAEDEKNNSLS